MFFSSWSHINCISTIGVMKQEMYYGKIYRSYRELESAITNYIRYYNEERIKEKLNWRSPVEYRKTQAT